MKENAIFEASQYINSHAKAEPVVGLILGSGLGVLGNEINDQVVIPYSDIPHFPTSTVAGHEGQLVLGNLEGKQVIAMQGRFHYYEGYSMDQVTFPVRVMKELGIQSIIVTNAAGGINKEFSPGDLMLISDHINNMGTNPLIGPNDNKLGVRFPDMSTVYDEEYIQMFERIAMEFCIMLKKGFLVCE